MANVVSDELSGEVIYRVLDRARRAGGFAPLLYHSIGPEAAQTTCDDEKDT